MKVQKRLRIFTIGGLLVLLVIAVRFAYVQLFLWEELTKQGKDSWSRNIVFQPSRGEIVDRNNVQLASNMTAPTVFIVPSQIKNPQATAEKLAEILNLTPNKVYTEITKKASSVYIRPAGMKLSMKKAKMIQKLKLPGVYIAEDTKRFYPYGDFLAHVLGFSGSDSQGFSGLELQYDQFLKGTTGSVQYFSDAKGKRMAGLADRYDAPHDGNTVQLTIDTTVQTIVERELDNVVATYQPDNALAIAMNPKTGEILAMSSRPNFAPANYQKVPVSVYNRNLPVWSTYEPGSTFKIITLAGALNEGLVDLDKDTFFDRGEVEVSGATLHCWKAGGHGSQTFLEVVANSCNPGFVELGRRLGAKKLFRYIDDFGFGEKTGVDLPGEGTGILFQPEQIGPVEAATTAFGQGVSVTPIQQIAAVSAAINGGTLYQPYITKEIRNPETGEILQKNKPVVKAKEVISEAASKEVRRALENVVASGSARGAYIEGYRVGGKTGTAQKVSDGKYLEGNYILSTIGFAPANDPEIIVYVAVDNPKGVTQYGGVVAAPIVGNILKDALPALGIQEQPGGLEKEIVWPEVPSVEVPDLVGMELEEAKTKLGNLQLEVEGKGKKIIRQSPEAGEKIPPDGKIRVYVGA